MTTLYFPVGLRLADRVWDETHTRIPWKHTTGPSERWVYVLAKTEQDAKPWLYAELYFDEQLGMRALDMDRARSEPGKRKAPLRPRAERRSLAEQTAVVWQLPILCEVLGKPMRYWIWGSSFALEQAGLDLVAEAALRGEIRQWSPDTDQAVAAYFDVNTRSGTPTSLPYLPIFDPAHIADKIQQRLDRILRARSALLEDEALRNQVLLARLIMGIDGFAGVKLRDEFKGSDAYQRWRLSHVSAMEAPVVASLGVAPTTAAREMKDLVKDYDEKLHAYTQRAEKVSKELCAFLETPGFRLFEKTASEAAGGLGSHYAQAIGMVCRGFGSTETGKHYLSDVIDSDSWFVGTVIAPEAPLDVRDVQARTEFERELLDWYEAISTPLNPVHEYLSNTVLAMTYGTASRAERVANGVNMLLQKDKPRYVVREVSSGGRTGYVLEAKGAIVERPTAWAAAKRFGTQALSVVELHCAAMEVANAFVRKDLDGKAELEALGSLVSIAEQVVGLVGRPHAEASAAQAVKLTGRRRAEFLLGTLGAAIDLFVSALEFVEANEDDVRLGKGISCVGAAVTLVSAALSGPVGWLVAGSLLSTSGKLVAELCRDSPLELLVRHSTWGERYGQPGQPPVDLKDWMRGGFVGWEKPVDKSRSQLDAMASILSSFRVSAANLGVRDNCALRIDCGFVPLGARFRIAWSSRAVPDGRSESCVIYVVRQGRGYRVLSEDRRDITGHMMRFLCEFDSSGGSTITVSVPKGFAQELWCEAEVSLELPSGRLRQIPDRPLRFVRCAGSVDAHDDARSSLGAPHESPKLRVARYAYHIGRDHPRRGEEVSPLHVGAPIEIGLRHVPAGAELWVHWSVGKAWRYAESGMRWEGSRWRALDPGAKLRLFGAMRERVCVSFPRAVTWNYGEPVKVRVELRTAASRYQAPDFFVYDGQRAASHSVSSAQA